MYRTQKYGFKTRYFDIQHDCFYDGYWQHEEYFKDIRSVILKAFTFPILKDKNLEIWKVVQKVIVLLFM